MTSKIPVERLIGHARENPTWEAAKAKAMFGKFMAGDFSYDEISNRPDYPAYASAEVLATILPLMIDEMLVRGDTVNFLVYPLIAAVDPSEGRVWMKERTKELIKLIDHEVAGKILRLLMALRADPPVPIERLDRLTSFWKSRAESSVPPS